MLSPFNVAITGGHDSEDDEGEKDRDYSNCSSTDYRVLYSFGYFIVTK